MTRFIHNFDPKLFVTFWEQFSDYVASAFTKIVTLKLVITTHVKYKIT